MMHGIDEQLLAELHRRADGQVDSDALLAGALARGRTRARRLHVAMALGVVSVAGVTSAVLAAGSLGLSPGAGSGGVGATGMNPSGAIVTQSPTPPVRGHYTVQAPVEAAGAGGASQQPNLVGSDPRMIHFRIGTLTLPVNSATWSVAGAIESLDIGMTDAIGNQQFVRVRVAHGQSVPNSGQPIGLGPAPGQPSASGLGLAASPSETSRSVTVAGMPGTLTQTTYVNKGQDASPSAVRYVLRWQPVLGVAVEVSSGLEQNDLLAVANALRFDAAGRCGAPLRFTALPTGGRLVGCAVTYWDGDLNPGRGPFPNLTIANDAGATISVAVNDRPTPAANVSASPTTLPNGWKAGVVKGGVQSIQIYDADGMGIAIAALQGYSAANVATVAAGIRRSGELAKPDTWPVDPLQ